MSKEDQSPAKWQDVSQRKKDEQYGRIPADWRLKTLPGPHVKSYMDIPRNCGLLSKEELDITEKYDAVALAQAIKDKQVKCVDVTRAFCKRAAIAHQLTNCLTEIFFDDALKRAQELDHHLASGNPPLGFLHGVPISLKDTFKVRGYDASIGLAALCFKPAQENSTLVECLLRAGAVLYCKTNIPQTLMALDSHNNIFGRTINPLNTAVTAGGSSGGEGALVAMRGSILGVGTDVGGSIRIPAMCDGTFGVKPSWDRIPYAGQEGGALPGASKIGIPASAGPLAHSMRDIELFFSAISAQQPWTTDADVAPLPWTPSSSLPKKLRIGIVRRDGVIDPHPPIARLLDEVKSNLQNSGVQVVEADITSLFSQCQSLANALFGVEGGNAMLDLLESFNEPLSPWLATRLKRKKHMDLKQVQQLHGKRDALRKQFLKIWKDEHGDMDAFVCPVAPHPVPPIDRYNGVSYTSSFVLLDYPAGVVPVRIFEEKDMQGEMEGGKPLGSWDKANRELWTGFDRSVYLGTPLCVQVVAPRLQEEKLVQAMAAIDDAVRGKRTTTAKL
ncbi:acetamidase [Pyrenophora tritici-repentis]|uniref:amidase n=2 Tax=Pyrenophora tritici-repentis TaxID=45151 RepID=A0A2W1G9H1_9PLEO|nr:acetamidase [Pyrenophora tritici-repentis Pt-1C-BFP]KAA8621321.1 Acetamidase [Pyrenophora tritici-repentis]EDU43702.1 acetamidase [Pyrenophora tritici-repentis Pt-1C-BFP]KAF7450555.1 Acetamidase [Pyrenophora tritici-repentis]KAF7573173.1 Amidase domain containing protein [Pyrenophora tritici-repentis]KAG9381223.1 Acetamidase [Pyrenophora tritici-repentis]